MYIYTRALRAPRLRSYQEVNYKVVVSRQHMLVHASPHTPYDNRRIPSYHLTSFPHLPLTPAPFDSGSTRNYWKFNTRTEVQLTKMGKLADCSVLATLPVAVLRVASLEI